MDVIIFGCLCVFFLIKLGIKRIDVKKVIAKNKDSKGKVIKYDVEDKTGYVVLFTVSILATGYCFMSGNLKSLDTDSNYRLYYAASIIYGIIFIYSVLKYVVVSLYLGGLKKKGYILPGNKEDYAYSYSKLLKSGDETLEDGEAIRDRLTIFIARVMFIIYILCNIYDLSYALRNRDKGPVYMDITKIMLVIDVIWLISAFIYYLKSDNRKYKDVYQDAKGRKNRFSIPATFLYVIILIFITIFAKKTADHMAKYILQTNTSKNAQLEDTLIHEFRKLQNENAILPDELEMLKHESNMLEWENNSDYRDVLLKRLGVDSFADLEDRIKNENDDPKIMVYFDGTDFVVYIENVYRYTD